MKDSERRHLRTLGIVVAAGALSFASIVPVVDAQDSSPAPKPTPVQSPSFIEEQIASDSTGYRTAVMADKSIFVCFSDEEPTPIDLDLNQVPEFIDVFDADCAELMATGEFALFENKTVSIPVVGNAEIVDLGYYRSINEPIPPIFETIPNNVLYRP